MDTVDALETIFGIEADARAVQFQGRWSTYGELWARIEAIREQLRATGCAHGTAVAAVLPNRPEGLVALLAVLLERGCMVSISPRQRDLELERAPATVAVVEGDQVEGTGLPAGRYDGTAVLMATSGTIGEPRRIPITYATIDAVVSGVRRLASGGDRPPELKNDTTLVCFPYTSLSGLLPQIIALLSGRRTALVERFDPISVAALVAEHQMTSLALNPTAMRMLLSSDVDPAQLATVRYVRSGSAPLSADLASDFEDRFGVGVLQSYGQTEVGGEIVGWSTNDHRQYGDAKRGSVGRPHPGIELRVLPRGESLDTTSGLTADQVGELWVKGAPNVEGWHRMGDLARIDGDGFVWIEGRADGVIICGGFNIVPAAVERVLEQHPSVAEAAVVARPDDRLGEIPVALVVPREEVVDVTALLTHCRSFLEPFQMPRSVVVVDDLPRTELGKVHLPSARSLAAATTEPSPSH